MRHDHYILNGRELVPATLMGWATWFETANRHIGDTRVKGARVSTVFLGIDHAMGGPPQLFETMIFRGHRDVFQDRYATWDQAHTIHKIIVRSLRMSKRQLKTQSRTRRVTRIWEHR
jgi:hypothetical protein